MDPASITAYITRTFADVHPATAWGELAFFYNPGHRLPRGIYFVTIKEKDGDRDRASNLGRPGIFRLNIGISRPTWRERFGPQPARPAAGGVVATGHDSAVLDQLVPHPVYGWMSWVSVLNPSAATFETLKPLLAEAHDLAVAKFAKRVVRG